MSKRKIVVIDGMTASGKSTTSYNLARQLPGWVFLDVWRIKDMFEPIGYSSSLDRKEAGVLAEIAKEETMRLAKEVMRKTRRNIILQELTVEFVKKKLGRELKKQGYGLFSVQLRVPLGHAVKRDKKRGKPTLGVGSSWTEEKWDEKVDRKIKKGDLVVDTSRAKPDAVVKMILKHIGEQAGKHAHADKIRRFW
jgi:cytidylate kinase